MMHITETCRDSSQDALPGRSDGGGSEELRLSEGPDGVCCDVAETPEGTRLFARVGGGHRSLELRRASSLGDSADDVTHIPHAQEWGKRRKVKFKCRSMEFCLLLRHSVLDTKK